MRHTWVGPERASLSVLLGRYTPDNALVWASHPDAAAVASDAWLAQGKSLPPAAILSAPPTAEGLSLLAAHDALAAAARPEFQAVASFPGFRRAFSTLANDWRAAGGATLTPKLRDLTRRQPHGTAFLAVWDEWHARIKAIAAPTATNLPLITLGDLAPADLAHLASLPHAHVLLPLSPTSTATRAALASLGFEERTVDSGHTPPEPPLSLLLRAPTVTAEAEQIASRLASASSKNSAAIAVDPASPLIPALRAALLRFGVTYTDLLPQTLDRTPLFAFLDGLVTALSRGWPHRELLCSLENAATGFHTHAEGRSFLIRMRETLSQSGLAVLKRLSPADPVRSYLGQLGALELKSSELHPAAHWFESAHLFTDLLAPPLEPTSSAIRQREHFQRALTAFEQAWRAVCDAGADDSLTLLAFWQRLRIVAEGTQLATPSAIHSSVLILPLSRLRFESYPHVILPGLTSSFPIPYADDPILGEAARSHLRQAGLRLPDAAAHYQRQRFELAGARHAALETCLASFALADEQGNRLQPSHLIDPAEWRTLDPIQVRPQPLLRKLSPVVPTLSEPESKQWLRSRHRRFRPTALESFLQCPFQFFARHTLDLDATAKPIPGSGLDMRLQGLILHETLSTWHRMPLLPLTEIFGQVFHALTEAAGLAPDYHLALARQALLRDLIAFEKSWNPVPGWTIETEHEFESRLPGGIRIHGRMDRFDRGPRNAAVVYEYKYSGKTGIARRVREQQRFLQGGLYLHALRGQGYHPAGFQYVGLRGGVTGKGWHDPADIDRILNTAVQTAIEAVLAIQSGDIRVAPQDRTVCSYCEVSDACRIRSAAEQIVLIQEAAE